MVNIVNEVNETKRLSIYKNLKINFDNNIMSMSVDKINTDDGETEEISFILNEATPQEIRSLRETTTPYLVYKMDEKIFYTQIPKDFDIKDQIHKCAEPGGPGRPGGPCKHLSAASDKLGGCDKVRKKSTCIEKFQFITLGYETFNTERDCFIVLKCTHYEKCPPRKKFTLDQIHRLQISLAQFVWPDVTTLDEIKKRIEENMKKK